MMEWIDLRLFDLVDRQTEDYRRIVSVFLKWPEVGVDRTNQKD
jgi:hypothetical protein